MSIYTLLESRFACFLADLLLAHKRGPCNIFNNDDNRSINIGVHSHGEESITRFAALFKALLVAIQRRKVYTTSAGDQDIDFVRYNSFASVNSFAAAI
jgi:hypothetical protein